MIALARKQQEFNQKSDLQNLIDTYNGLSLACKTSNHRISQVSLSTAFLPVFSFSPIARRLIQIRQMEKWRVASPDIAQALSLLGKRD